MLVLNRRVYEGGGSLPIPTRIDDVIWFVIDLL